MTSNVFNKMLAVDKDNQELLQSFIRVGINADDDLPDKADEKSSKSNKDAHKGAGERRKSVRFNEEGESDQKGVRGNRMEAELRAARRRRQEQELLLKKKPKENFVDFYTDKDRAAAVSAGAYDIKQSLQIKQKQDRCEAMMVPEEADINSIIALGLKEIKNANAENAIHFFSKVYLC